MNWLGLGKRTWLAIIVGCLAGFLAFGVLATAGWDAPWVVGLCAGLAAALVSTDQSVMRGLIVGTLAVWTAATAESRALVTQRGGELVDALLAFHQTLDCRRIALHLVCAALAIGLGSTSFRRGAERRTLGT